MRVVMSLLGMLFICLFCGCSAEKGDKPGIPMQDSPAVNESIGKSGGPSTNERLGEITGLEFYKPETGGPDLSNGEQAFRWFNITGGHIGDITLALNWYKSDNGEWPETWDDITNGYLLFLPANPSTGDAVPLLTLDEVNGSVEADSIVADINNDGWELYQAGMDAARNYTTRKVFTRAMAASMLDATNMHPADDRMGNFILAIRVLAASRVSRFLILTAGTDGAPRMPASYEDLTIGLVRNPNTTLGYTPGQDGTGAFKFGVKPESMQTAFVYKTTGETFEIHQFAVDPQTGEVTGVQELRPGDANYSRDGFIWILTYEDFMN